ncbi:GumC family protein [Sphingobacterium sp. HJSM2_6]|uniref:GumC family protein n=1 Tax=Sphingobacterium sp. HJSM2_6 TaxID=3366264 RepID=UPI003BCE18D7
MNTMQKAPDLLRNKQDKSLNVLDLIKYYLANWKWFILSILIFGGYYFYDYSKTPFLYSRSQTVMIKTSSNTISPSRITRPNNFYNAVNVNSEILQLRSKELMRNTIQHLNANINYTIKSRLREIELYNTSPYIVTFINSNPNSAGSFRIAKKNDQTVILSTFNGLDNEKSIEVKLNSEVKTPVGSLYISANPDLKYRKFTEPYLTVTKIPLEQSVGEFLGKLRISQMEDVEILQLTLDDSSPVRAGDMITKIIQVYNQMTIENKNAIARNTSEFIKERIALIETELSNVETDLEQMKTQNQGLDVKAAGEQYWSESRTYEASSKEIETQMKLVEIMRNRLSDPSRVNDLIPSNTGLVDNNIESIISEYNVVLLKRNRLLADNNSGNPIVQDLDNALVAMRENIQRAIENVITGFTIKIRNLKQDEGTAISKARRIPAKQRIMLSVERQQKVKEELYIFLLNRREENEINQAMTDDNLRIIDSAAGSDFPIYPNKIKKLAIGVGIGVLVPAVLLTIMLLLNTKVRSRKDIENELSVPFLGEIPHSADLRSAESDVVVKEQGTDEVTEAFRIFRTNIGFMAAGLKDKKVITFTSFNVGAGKTFSVINLGVSMTFLNKKIVVVDLDLRKGTLSNKSREPMPIGVTHYLSDPSVALNDIIYPNGIDGRLDIIPIGVIAPNPVELLLGNRLDQLFTELKERYDHILVDNVPLGIVADASIANRISDTTLFVIRAGKMDKRQLADVQDLYDSKNLTNMAVLLNGVKFNSTIYGYGGNSYGYGGYGYGYGYGYGNTKKRNFFSRLFK